MNTASVNSIASRIGRIIRLFREKTGKNQSDIARTAGISTSMLSQIERGMVSPSMDTLVDVCTVLDLDMADLFARVSPRKPVRVVEKGERLKTEDRGVRFEQLITSTDLLHPAEMFLLEVKPGRQIGLSGKGHEGVEMGYVLAGNAILSVENIEYALARGDSVSFSSHLPHKLMNSHRSSFKAIWAVLPPHRDYLDMGGGRTTGND